MPFTSSNDRSKNSIRSTVPAWLAAIIAFFRG